MVRFPALLYSMPSATIGRVAPTVVIVDDHPSFRASARAMLEAGGFEVIAEAADGSTALELLHRLRPDVVLLDVQLPDMSGFDVCVECGDVEETAVILVSSRDGADFGDLIERCGARGFIPKAELTGEAVAAFVS
jgi:DNA-binding NarL/FixJ family response regulator